jgi:hypothetical protein
VFLFFVYLGFQTKVKDLKVEDRNVVLGAMMGGIRNMQETVVLAAGLGHQLHSLGTNRGEPEVKNCIIHCIILR